MVIAYEVLPRIEPNKSGKRSRGVKYVNTKYVDAQRQFLVDKEGKFTSNAYGGLDDEGNPKASSRNEAFDMIAAAVSKSRHERYVRAKERGDYDRPKRAPKQVEEDSDDNDEIPEEDRQALDKIKQLENIRREVGWNEDDIYAASDKYLYMSKEAMDADVAEQTKLAKDEYKEKFGKEYATKPKKSKKPPVDEKRAAWNPVIQLEYIRKALGWSRKDIYNATEKYFYMSKEARDADVAEQLKHAKEEYKEKLGKEYVDRQKHRIRKVTTEEDEFLNQLKGLMLDMGYTDEQCNAYFDILDNLPAREQVKHGKAKMRELRAEYEAHKEKYEESQKPKKPKKPKLTAKDIDAYFASLTDEHRDIWDQVALLENIRKKFGWKVKDLEAFRLNYIPMSKDEMAAEVAQQLAAAKEEHKARFGEEYFTTANLMESVNKSGRKLSKSDEQKVKQLMALFSTSNYDANKRILFIEAIKRLTTKDFIKRVEDKIDELKNGKAYTYIPNITIPQEPEPEPVAQAIPAPVPEPVAQVIQEPVLEPIAQTIPTNNLSNEIVTSAAMVERKLTNAQKQKIAQLATLFDEIKYDTSNRIAFNESIKDLPTKEFTKRVSEKIKEAKAIYKEMYGKAYTNRPKRVFRSAKTVEAEPVKEKPKPKRTKKSAKPVTEAEKKEYNELIAKDLFATPVEPVKEKPKPKRTKKSAKPVTEEEKKEDRLSLAQSMFGTPVVQAPIPQRLPPLPDYAKDKPAPPKTPAFTQSPTQGRVAMKGPASTQAPATKQTQGRVGGKRPMKGLRTVGANQIPARSISYPPSSIELLNAQTGEVIGRHLMMRSPDKGSLPPNTVLKVDPQTGKVESSNGVEGYIAPIKTK